MGATSYAIALGSNRRHGRHGGPRAVVEAALAALDAQGLTILSRSRIHDTPAFGVAGRSYANAAAIIATDLDPPTLLRHLKAMERAFGRRSGQRWGSRVLDLDILLQLPGLPSFPPNPSRYRGTLTLPHPGLPTRDFVLEPLEQIAPDRRHPHTGLTVRQLRARRRRAKPVDATPPRS